ncbi:MAG: ATP-binding cassette subfamily B protein [Bacteriovoracaceae bacterium]|jgi:ATP-binding cassette subfamily B protein
MNSTTFFFQILRSYSYHFLFTCFLLLFDTLFSGAVAISVGPIIDFLISPDGNDVSKITSKFLVVLNSIGFQSTLPTLLVLFLVLQVLKSTFTVIITYTVAKTKYEVMRNLTVDLFKDFFEAKWEFFTQSNQGVLINTLMRELQKIGDAFFSMAMFFTKFLQLIIYLAIPLYVSTKLTLIFLASSIVLLLPFFILTKLNYSFGVKNRDTGNKLSSIILEDLGAAKIILGYGEKLKSTLRLDRAYREHADAATKVYGLGTLLNEVSLPLGILSLLITLYLTRGEGVKISDMAIIIWSLKQASSFMGILLNTKGSVESFFPSYKQLLEIRKKAQDLKQSSGDITFESIEYSIEVNNLYFSHDGEKETLKDVSLKIPKGSMIALAGQSGSGKSTIVDLILGFLVPKKGSIKIDGTDLSKFDLTKFRKKIGYVPQESVLFNMSIRENLLWAKEDATEQDILEALKKANALEFIQDMKHGIDSNIGDRGVKLSGGQRQRIALARAIIREPELVILDEATSALDNHSENQIQMAIENLAKSTTIIIVAHRISTIVNADQIYALKDGEVAEFGTYRELCELDGYFANQINSNRDVKNITN